MENASANKGFITEMIGQKKQLSDYPDKVCKDMVVHEPSSLPFGGIYRGYKAFEALYPAVRSFYDFSRFELLEVFAEESAVFALLRAGIAGSDADLMLCEHFTFKDGKILEVRLFLYDFPGKALSSLGAIHKR